MYMPRNPFRSLPNRRSFVPQVPASRESCGTVRLIGHVRPAAAFFDLDRTLVSVASPKIFQRHLSAAGFGTPVDGTLADLAFKVFELVGESSIVGQSAELAPRAAVGWPVDAVIAAAGPAAAEIAAHVSDFAAPSCLIAMRDAPCSPPPRRSTCSAPRRPRHRRRHRHEMDAGRQRIHRSGRRRRLGSGQTRRRAAVVRRARRRYRRAVGRTPAAITTRRCSTSSATLSPSTPMPACRHRRAQRLADSLLDKPDGVPTMGGLELQDLFRPFLRPELIPNADVTVSGLEYIHREGGAIIVGNHRSYFDPAVMITTVAKSGRNGRYLGKKEVFDIPVIGRSCKRVVESGSTGAQVTKAHSMLQRLPCGAAMSS